MKKTLLAAIAFFLLVPMSSQGEQTMGPADRVAAFHEALASGDENRILEMLSPDLIIFEDSDSEASRREYSSHHLEADMKFSAKAKRKILDQSVKVSGETSWVMTRYQVQGTVGNRRIKLESAETMVLEKSPGGWRISHIHWSNKVL